MYLKPILIATTFLVTAIAGCTMPASDEGDAQVAFYVKDAPADEFDSVFVSFTKVEVHRTGGGDGVESAEDAPANATSAPTNATAPATNATAPNATTSTSAASAAGWITLFSGNETIDLKAFQGDAKAFLGEANITAGKYTQIRIHVSEAYGMMNETRVNFTLPSGKLKLTGPWEAVEGQATQLVVDFLLERSIHKTGQDKYMFKPTLKLNVEKKERLSAEDTEDPSMAATKAKAGKPTDKGRPTDNKTGNA